MTKQQRMQDLLTQAGRIADELSAEGQDTVLVMLDPANRNEVTRGLLTGNVVVSTREKALG